MKKIIISLLILFGNFSNTIWSQKDTLNTDSLKIDKVKPGLCYLGFGIGPVIRGGCMELSLTISSSNYWGGSLNFRTGFVLMADLPADYDGQIGRLHPLNDFSILSFNLVKKFPTSERSVRFGFETGPSWVRYNLTELELNPKYPDLFQYKYNKIHSLKSAFGLTLAAKAEFPFSRYVGCELTAFTIINKLQSVLGFDLCFNLGKVRK